MQCKTWTFEQIAGHKPDLDWHAEAIEAIRALLRDRPPQQQGAVLMEVVAVWIVGHPPDMRDKVLALWVDTIKSFIPIVHAEIFGDKGYPRKPTHPAE